MKKCSDFHCTNNSCEVAGLDQEHIYEEGEELSVECHACGKQVMINIIQRPGFRTDHTWDEGTENQH